MAAAQRLTRRAWRGAFLRSLGHASWAVEQTPSGISFLGGRHQAPFSVWTGPARLTSTMGFATIAVPLAGGRVARLAGVATHDAASFITSANAAFCEHVLGQFAAAEDELSALFEVIGRLDRPRRYPAARPLPRACGHRHRFLACHHA